MSDDAFSARTYSLLLETISVMRAPDGLVQLQLLAREAYGIDPRLEELERRINDRLRSLLEQETPDPVSAATQELSVTSADSAHPSSRFNAEPIMLQPRDLGIDGQ